MKYLKVAAILLLAFAVCVPAFAETQTVKVSGSLDAYWIYRNNFDLNSKNDTGVIPAGTAVRELACIPNRRRLHGSFLGAPP